MPLNCKKLKKRIEKIKNYDPKSFAFPRRATKGDGSIAHEAKPNGRGCNACSIL